MHPRFGLVAGSVTFGRREADAIVSPQSAALTSQLPCNTANIIRLAHLHGYLILIAFDHVQVLSRH
jgi:hypothetical protein